MLIVCIILITSWYEVGVCLQLVALSDDYDVIYSDKADDDDDDVYNTGGHTTITPLFQFKNILKYCLSGSSLLKQRCQLFLNILY